LEGALSPVRFKPTFRVEKSAGLEESLIKYEVNTEPTPGRRAKGSNNTRKMAGVVSGYGAYVLVSKTYRYGPRRLVIARR